jgi:hypothetical protein
VLYLLVLGLSAPLLHRLHVLSGPVGLITQGNIFATDDQAIAAIMSVWGKRPVMVCSVP